MTCDLVSLCSVFQGGRRSEDEDRAGWAGLGWLACLAAFRFTQGEKGRTGQGCTSVPGSIFKSPVARPPRHGEREKKGEKREREANGCHGKSWLAGRQAKLK